MDQYVAFVKKYQKAIDLCASVDVLPFRNPGRPPAGMDSHSLSYRNLKYLEKAGIKPVPVVHLGADINIWFRRYVEEGYQTIGLGGLVGSLAKPFCKHWVDRCFDFICKKGKPRVRLHGFGVTSHEYLLRYPWWSVDSTTWTKKGAFGQILMPRYRRGNWIFTQDDLVNAGLSADNWPKHCNPWNVFMSEEHPTKGQENSMHFLSMKLKEQQLVKEWLRYLAIPLGTVGGNRDGVLTCHDLRRIANLKFFEILRDELDPKYRRRAPRGFNSPQPPKIPKKRKGVRIKEEGPIIFYSGRANNGSHPEEDTVLGTEANVMLTFEHSHNKTKPDPRFRRIAQKRGCKIED